MKNFYFLSGLLLTMALMVSATLFATDYEVSGAGWDVINGIYTEEGTQNGKPLYREGEYNFEMTWDGMQWIITDYRDVFYTNNTNSDTPPETGWQVQDGPSPAPTVSIPGPELSYDSDIFQESSSNDGTIDQSVTISLQNSGSDTFSGSNGTFSTNNFSTANVPDGLSLTITKNSDTELSVELNGTATSHTNSDDIFNLEISFNDNAFAEGNASSIDNTTKSNFQIDFVFELGSLSDLQNLSENPENWNDYIIQTADIDASNTSTWNSGAGFTPIGNGTTNFTGTFNGNYYEISNLYINTASAYAGLFGYIESATIENIRLVDIDYTAGGNSGGLVGQANSSYIENCLTSGTIAGENALGGIVGYSRSSSSIINCVSAVDLSSDSYQVGGIIGLTELSLFSNCYARGDITRNAGSDERYGGFCGYNYASTIEYSYSTGSVFYSNAANPTKKGFVGHENSSTSYTANFFDNEASNQSSDEIGAAMGLTTTQMKNINSFTDESNTWLSSAWDMKGTQNDDSGTDDYWDIENSINDGYPFLMWENGADDTLAPTPDVDPLADITAECEVNALTAPTAQDNFAGEITATHDKSLPIITQGTTVITWTYDDGNGNITTQTQNVVIEDISDPTATCIDNQTVNANESHTYTVNGTEFDLIESDDNCGIASVLNSFNDAETLANAELPEGTTTIEWTVTDNAGNTTTCSFNVSVGTYTGITESPDSKIFFYPNPFSNKLNIEFQGNNKNIKFEILNANGQVVFTGTLMEQTSVNTSNFAPGVYLIKTENGKNSEIRKVLKK